MRSAHNKMTKSKANKRQPLPEDGSVASATSATEPVARNARPLSVTIPALLHNGSDQKFRQLIYGLLAIGGRLTSVRQRFGQHVGVSDRQFWMLMVIADYTPKPGVRAATLAERLFVSRPFVTVEVKGLVRLGLVCRRPDPTDARSTLLTLTESGISEIRRLTPLIRLFNDTCFQSPTHEQFEIYCQLISMTVADLEVAISAMDAFEIQEDIGNISNSKSRSACTG